MDDVEDELFDIGRVEGLWDDSMECIIEWRDKPTMQVRLRDMMRVNVDYRFSLLVLLKVYAIVTGKQLILNIIHP